MLATPFIGGLALIVAARVTAGIITGGISYAISASIKSDYWVEQTETHKYTAPNGHVIYADPTC